MNSKSINLNRFLTRISDEGSKMPDYFVLIDGEEYDITNTLLNKPINPRTDKWAIQIILSYVRNEEHGKIWGSDWSVEGVVRRPHSLLTKVGSYGILIS